MKTVENGEWRLVQGFLRVSEYMLQQDNCVWAVVFPVSKSWVDQILVHLLPAGRRRPGNSTLWLPLVGWCWAGKKVEAEGMLLVNKELSQKGFGTACLIRSRMFKFDSWTIPQCLYLSCEGLAQVSFAYLLFFNDAEADLIHMLDRLLQ